MIPGNLPSLAASLRTGDLPVAAYLDHLEAVFTARDSSVIAFLPEEARFDRLRAEAVDLLKRFPRAETRPPLFGVPIGVKDIFQVAGFETRAGSKLPPELLQGAEAESVTVLKDAGALVLGKTVTTEFAYFGPGPTRNPHNLEHTPGGSSSGSAAAIAANLCALTLGTQTIGSIVRPASFCGVVGFKPSYGRISRAGVIPLAPSVDHVGLFTTDVAGARFAAEVMCQKWRYVTGSPPKPTLGIPEGPYLKRASAKMLAHFREVCRKLRQSGFEVRTVNAMPDFEQIYDRHFLITNGEAARVHREWFPRYRDRYHPKTVEKLEQGNAISEDQLALALRERQEFSEAMQRLMAEHGIDLWLTPAAVGAAPRGLDVTGDPVLNLPWSHARFPVLSLPTGRSANGLPLGLQLVATLDDDERLLAWAGEIERVRVG